MNIHAKRETERENKTHAHTTETRDGESVKWQMRQIEKEH